MKKFSIAPHAFRMIVWVFITIGLLSCGIYSIGLEIGLRAAFNWVVGTVFVVAGIMAGIIGVIVCEERLQNDLLKARTQKTGSQGGFTPRR